MHGADPAEAKRPARGPTRRHLEVPTGRAGRSAEGNTMDLLIPDVLEDSCATRQALERLASKWRVLLIYSLLAGPQRHAELRRRLPDITQKMLTQTLRGMVEDGL